MMKKSGFLLLSILLLAALTSGCVSNSTRSQPTVDKDKRLENRLQLATNYIQSNNRERAREHLARALEVDSRSPKVHDLYALLYLQEREFALAEKHYKKALSYDATFTRGRNNYGSLLLRQGRAAEACKQFRKGAGDLEYARRFELFYKIGLCAVRLDDSAGAREAFVKSLALNQQFGVAALELAQLSFADRDYTRSRQYLNHYNNYRRGPSARGLWLGIRLEQISGNKDARDSQGLALKNLFPGSEENKQYQSWLKNGYRH